MSADKFNVKSEIMSQIAKTGDDNLRTILLLLLGVLDEIGSKIDSVLNDEHTIKAMVLNGHVADHHDHHTWLDRRIEEDAELQVILARARPALEWVEKQKAAQEQAAKDNRGSVRKVLESTTVHLIVTIGAIFFAAWVSK